MSKLDPHDAGPPPVKTSTPASNKRFANNQNSAQANKRKAGGQPNSNQNQRANQQRNNMNQNSNNSVANNQNSNNVRGNQTNNTPGKGQQQHANNSNNNRQPNNANKGQLQANRGHQGRGQPPDDSYRAWKNNLPLLGAPTLDLPEKPKDQKKFTGRCRLFVANLPVNITEDGLKELFSKYGEVSEVFLGKGNTFAFVKMDTRRNAEEARSKLDFSVFEGRTLRVRLAAHAAAIRVTNLTPMVTNELLEHAFSYFGEVERAVVIADDRGRSTGEGIVEFSRKSAMTSAVRRCQQDCFFLTAIPQVRERRCVFNCATLTGIIYVHF